MRFPSPPVDPALIVPCRVYRILAITVGTPPKADEPFTWEYYTKDKKFKSITTTPLEFYHKYAGVDVSLAISLINDPRNKYEQLYTVEHLGNVWGGRPVLYVNTEVQQLKDTAIALLKADTPVWFVRKTPLPFLRGKLAETLLKGMRCRQVQQLDARHHGHWAV